MNQLRIYLGTEKGDKGMNNKKEVLLKLFVSTLYLSAFTFCG